MENQNLKTGILHELIFCLDIDLEEDDFLKNILPIYLRKLGCFMSAVFKIEQNDIVEKEILPRTVKEDKTWTKLTEIIHNIPPSEKSHEVIIENKFYYFYRLNKYGYFVLGRKNVFDNNLKDELVFIANFLGKILYHSHLEQLKKISDERYANESRLLRTIIDNMPVNIYTKDLQYKKTLVNKSDIAYLNKKNEDEVLGKDDFDFFEPELAHTFLADDKLVIEKGVSIVNEEKYIGNGKWAYVSKLPLKDAQGNLKGLVGMSFDITNKKKEQDQLSFLFQILDNLSDSVRVMDGYGKVVYLNKASLKILNVSRENFQDFYIWEISNAFEGKAHWERYIHELRKNQTNIIESKNIDTETGIEHPIELNISFLHINGKQYVFSIGRDISKRKAAEKALRESEEFKASLISSINDIVFVLDNEFHVIEYHEPNQKELFKLPANYHNKNIDKIKISKEAKSTIKNTLTGCGDKKYCKGEFSVKEGNDEQWYEITSTQFKDQNGEKRGFTCSVRNITERIISNKIIKQQLYLQDILIRISSVYINADLEKVDESIQNSLKDLGEFVGCHRAYVYEYNFRDYYASKTYEWIAKGYDIQMEDTQKIPITKLSEQISNHSKGLEYTKNSIGNHHSDNLLPQPNASINSLTIPMVQSHRLIGYVGFDFVGKEHNYTQKEKDLLFVFSRMLVNVRERQAQETLLKLQEQKYRNIISNMRLGLIEVDDKERIQFANDTFCSMTGYSVKEILGKKVADSILFSENYDLESKIRKSRLNGKSSSYEVSIRNKNGEKNWWYIAGAPNFNDKKELIGSIGVFLDISDQKKMKSELEDALKNAEVASHAKELFLATMSHEIRTPLNVITGMIRQLAKENLTEKQKDYVRYSQNAAEHLLAIINNILDISKIESGEYELAYKDFSLSAMVANVKSILFTKIKDKNLEFILDVSENIKPALIGDVSRMRQILINLISNAVKFTEKGFIKLKVSVIGETVHSQHLLFEIEDSGIGMNKDFLSKLFDKFSQEMNENNRKFEGTGLGMSITKELIQLMGGNIDVVSQKDVGTKIYFDINLEIGCESKLINSKPLKYANSLTGTKVLLVEDNEMNRFIAIQSLKYAGCSVIEAVNGTDAVQKVKSEKFDIVLMDIQMPEMDGVEATKIIRNELKKELPIIALTANAFKHDIDNYISVGMNNYLIKPYQELDLFNMIEKYSTNFVNKEQTEKNITVAEPLYNTSLISEIGKGDKDFIAQIVQLFVELAEQTIAQITQSLKENDTVKIKQLAHKIKPNLDNMMIESLKTEIRALENFEVNEQNIQEFNKLAIYVRGSLQNIVEQIKTNENI